MQVYRLHGSESVTPPVTSRSAANGSGASSPTAGDAQDGASLDSGSTVGALLAQLRSTPDVRQAVVEQARAKVASGDYFTRPSAEATAEALLRNES